MTHRLSYRRYALEFRVPVRTAHGIWPVREGVLVRLETPGGDVGYGEAAPLPWAAGETVDAIEAACRRLGEEVDPAMLAAVPAELGCLRSALQTAGGQLPEVQATSARPVAALLPAGRAALPLLGPKAEAGFRVFKWKVGVGEVQEELGWLDELCARLPTGGKLRLDANGAWDRRTAERWLDRCAERPVEFVEQPCFVAATEGATAQQKVEDMLLGLAGDYPTPVALDESVQSDRDLARWLAAGWPGFYVLKPGLMGDMTGGLAALRKAGARVVFSSALETAVGARAALHRAFAWEGEIHALGFGVWPLFAEAALNGPTATPFIRWQDVTALNPEAAWNALS